MELMTQKLDDGQRGALLGSWIADALAMPVHWYYDRAALQRDYGIVDRYLAPRNPHADSILWRSKYQPASPETDILREQIQFWGQRGIHYHQFLQAGENTLNLQLSQILFESLVANDGYDQNEYLDRFVTALTKPGHHRDTYVEEYLRHFFKRYAEGVAPAQCGMKEKHIGGLSLIIPLVVCFSDRPNLARMHALRHLELTHTGELMQKAGGVVADLLLSVLHGRPLKEVILESCARQGSPFLGHPFSRWLSRPDEEIIGKVLSPACYVQDAVPAVIYLALKYHDAPRKALMVNTMLGGDNAHRGAVLGALLGAEHGCAGFPEVWRNQLLLRPDVKRELDISS